MTEYGPRHKITDEIREEIVQRYQDGEGLATLATEYHHSRYKIVEVLEGAGVTIRRRGMANPHACTPIEQRIHDALKSKGIGFQTQRRLVGRYVVDVVLNQAKIIIEADGVQHQWDKQRAHDARRDAAHEAVGYRTFRFTGSEINRDAVSCVQAVIDACRLTPDEDPTYSIKTSFTGPDHPNWTGGPQEYTCDRCGKIFTAHSSHRSNKRKFCTPACANKSRAGQKLSDEHRAKIANAVRGKKRKSPPPFTEEHRENLRKALAGKKKSSEHTAKVAEANRGKSVSQETRNKISESLRQYNQTKI